MHYILAAILPFGLDGASEERIATTISNMMQPHEGDDNHTDGWRVIDGFVAKTIPETMAPHAYLTPDPESVWEERNWEPYDVEVKHTAERLSILRKLMKENPNPREAFVLWEQWDKEHPGPITPWHQVFHTVLKDYPDCIVLLLDCHR